ncbi:MAG: lipopolysaccharide heptosyltransferase family protein [Proteobacteria bacterium]|nr:MAG: lipopolysaccharide heptosyltransferase family protein [Pseudomonadota bacterium]
MPPKMERGNARLKFFDRYLGPILLVLLLPLKLFRVGSSVSEMKSVGLLKTAAIGDTVLLSAIVSDLRAQNPKIKITLFTGASNFEFSKLLSGIDEVVKLPLTNPLNSVKLIRSQKFDVFFDFDPWPRISALLAALSAARVRVGFKTSGQHRHFMYDRAVEHRPDVHELANYRALLAAVGVAGTALPQDLRHPWKQGGETVVFHLWPSGTQSHLKEWNWDEWQKLAREILVLGDYRFVLTGGKEDVARTETLINGLPADLRLKFSSLAGSKFRETLGLLQNAALLVSVNTGIMHVGAAMGVPTIGLHGPTDPKRWGPVGPRTRSILSRSPNAGSLNLGFEYIPDAEYMSGISSAEVYEACRQLLRS